MSVIFKKSKPGKNKFIIPNPEINNYEEIDKIFLRKDDPKLPDVGESEVVRHYTDLSRMNFGVDNGMYPLGSCTMKYNPKINEHLSKDNNFTQQHPLAEDEINQGSLSILYELAELLSDITGMHSFTLSPAAGSHGELTGVMIIKKYFEMKGEKRTTILIPDSAHGTNPASVAMCGFKVAEVPSNKNGDVDIESLQSILNDDIAAMMLTSPNTLGFFDPNILKIAELLHQNGSLFYADGANMNAVVGRAKFSSMGFDIMHINLHKTFSTPHGGGGPGAGPVGVREDLVRFLPTPAIMKKKDGTFYCEKNLPDSIGEIHSFHGNFLVCLKAFIYIKMHGSEGLKKISGDAVLNANYLRSVLKKVYNCPFDRTCMHEFVINDEGIPNGITTNDIAKRIPDYGFHAPTVYFPLLVKGAIMIEPTETETLETLDSFAEAMINIRREAEEKPEIVKTSPHTTPVRRVDAVLAARKPILKWQK